MSGWHRYVLVWGVGWMLAPAMLSGAVAAEAASLDELKQSFEALLQERAALVTRLKFSTHTISEARRTTGADSEVRSPTARAYRQSVRQLERALDQHPTMTRLQEEWDSVQADKVTLGAEQAKVLDARHDMRVKRREQFSTTVTEASARAQAEQRALLKRAGVTDLRKLSPGHQRELMDIHARLTNDIAVARAALPKAAMTTEEREGFNEQLKVLNEELKALSDEQARLKTEMGQLRQRLRSTDPDIALLQKAAEDASRAHLEVADAAPQVIAAREFIRRVPALRSEIDTRARALALQILEQDPSCKGELDQQARSVGVRLFDATVAAHHGFESKHKTGRH